MNILSCTKEIKTFSCLLTYSSVRKQSRLSAVYEHSLLYEGDQDFRLFINIFFCTKTIMTFSCLWTYWAVLKQSRRAAVDEYILLYENSQGFQLFMNIFCCTKTVTTFSCLWSYSAVYQHTELYEGDQYFQFLWTFWALRNQSRLSAVCEHIQLLINIFSCLWTYSAVRRSRLLAVYEHIQLYEDQDIQLCMNIFSCTKTAKMFSYLWTYSAIRKQSRHSAGREKTMRQWKDSKRHSISAKTLSCL